jgi:ATP-dependent RNA helicase DDX21
MPGKLVEKPEKEAKQKGKVKKGDRTKKLSKTKRKHEESDEDSSKKAILNTYDDAEETSKDSHSKRKLEDGTEEHSDSAKSTLKKVKRGKVSSKDKGTVEQSATPNEAPSEPGDFRNFRISKETIKLLTAKGISTLFPIQVATFDAIYDGRDVIGRARTGTGKTLSFALPIVERLMKDHRVTITKRGRKPHVLVMAPTRELANQVCKEFESIAPQYHCLCIYGGVPYESQEQGMREGLDVVVGTPGRIIDHLRRENLNLSDINYLVMDEADQMLNIGFADDMEEILKILMEHKQSKLKTGERDFQVLLFSATLPEWIWKVVGKYLQPDRVMVDLIGQQKLKASETVQHLAMPCSYHMRRNVMSDVILVYGTSRNGHQGRTILFAETKQEVNELALHAGTRIDCQVLHGDIPQKQRELTLAGFRDGKFQCLAATDVAARGLDISQVDLIVQCEPPKDVETYIHRSGRTGRAGKSGTCLLFYKPDQEPLVKMIEKRAGITFSRVGAPQPADIIAASSMELSNGLKHVPDMVLPYFKDIACTLIEEYGAEKALCLTLAKLSGHVSAIKNRSLLTCAEGFTTMLVRTTYDIRTTSYIWNILGKKVPDLKEGGHIRGMRLCADSRGVVFDIPDGRAQELVDHWGPESYITIEIAKKIPELLEREAPLTTYSPSSYRDRKGSRNSFGSRSSFSSRGFSSGSRQSSTSSGGFRSRKN